MINKTSPRFILILLRPSSHSLIIPIFQFDRVCRLFSEDPTTTQSDEFFGIFDYFISSFEEARADNENVKKKKEEEEKIAKQHQEVNFNSYSISCSLPK